MTENEKEAYDRGYGQGKIQGKVDYRSEVCKKLKHWADATRPNNPDIAIGYDHAIALIKDDFQYSLDDWDGNENQEEKVESQSEADILMECINLMHDVVDECAEWYKWMEGEDAINNLSDEEMFRFSKGYMSIVQKLFLWHTKHSGGTSTCQKCRELGVDWSRAIEFGFEKDEEDEDE